MKVKMSLSSGSRIKRARVLAFTFLGQGAAMRAALLLLCTLPGIAAATGQSGTTVPDQTTTSRSAREAVSDGKGIEGFINWFRSGKAPPQEGNYQLPAVSTLSQWLDYDFTQHEKRNKYQIAIDSITIGIDDEIVRYVMSVKPINGNVKTVVFEGIDCNSNQYTRYASTTSDSGWIINQKSTWRSNSKEGVNAWQGYLADVMCSIDQPSPLEEIKANLLGDQKAFENPRFQRK
jgi:hypothetical protein